MELVRRPLRSLLARLLQIELLWTSESHRFSTVSHSQLNCTCFYPYRSGEQSYFQGVSPRGRSVLAGMASHGACDRALSTLLDVVLPLHVQTAAQSLPAQTLRSLPFRIDERKEHHLHESQVGFRYVFFVFCLERRCLRRAQRHRQPCGTSWHHLPWSALCHRCWTWIIRR